MSKWRSILLIGIRRVHVHTGHSPIWPASVAVAVAATAGGASWWCWDCGGSSTARGRAIAEAIELCADLTRPEDLFLPNGPRTCFCSRWNDWHGFNRARDALRSRRKLKLYVGGARCR